MSVLKLFWFSNDIVFSMSVVPSLGITGVRPSLGSRGTLASKKAKSKDTVESATGDAVEKVFMSFPIYEDTKLFINKKIKMK